MIGAFALGAAALAGAPLATDTVLEINLGGEVITNRVMLDSLEIEDAVAARSTASFEVYDSTGTYRPATGTQLYITEHGARLFAGTLDRVAENTTISGGHFLSIDAVDWNQLTDRFFVAATYTNQNLRQIVSDILNVQTPLRTEGIRDDEVQAGPLIDVATFNYKTVGDAFRDLAEASGYVWNIDAHKTLRFFDRTSYVAPFTVDDGNPIWTSASYSKNRGRYRNRQYLRAGVDLTDSRTEVFRGDNVSAQGTERRRTINVAYPIGTPPTILKDGIAQRVGIAGIDKDGDLTVPSSTTWPQWFYRIGSNEISQNSKVDTGSNPVFNDSNLLSVTYQGQIPMLIDTSNDVEQSARAAIEGGTGIYESMEEDSDLNGREFGSKKVDRLLALYGRIPGNLRLSTWRHGLAPGHLLTITFSAFGISSVQFLVDSVSVRWRGSASDGTEHLEYDVQLVDGERLEGWADFFRALADAGRKTVIRQNEKVIITRQPKDTVTFTDAFTDSVNNSVTELAYTADMYTYALVATQSVGGSTVYGWEMGRAVMGRPRGA